MIEKVVASSRAEPFFRRSEGSPADRHSRLRQTARPPAFLPISSDRPLHVTTVRAKLFMRWRIAVSAAIGFLSGTFCWFLMTRLHQDAADFRWAILLARHVVDGQNPYDTPHQLYPLTAAFFALPLLRLTPEVAAGIFWGI